jgi:hypothetical protein
MGCDGESWSFRRKRRVTFCLTAKSHQKTFLYCSPWVLSADSTSVLLAADRAHPCARSPLLQRAGDRYQASCKRSLHAVLSRWVCKSKREKDLALKPRRPWLRAVESFKKLDTGRAQSATTVVARRDARVRSQQHGRAVCGQRPLREKETFFGDFLPFSKKLPARSERKLLI